MTFREMYNLAAVMHLFVTHELRPTFSADTCNNADLDGYEPRHHVNRYLPKERMN